MGSTKVTDEKLQRVLNRIPPCTLSPQAWGSQSIEWLTTAQPVWAWVSWPHRAVGERLPAFAYGMNDRVVLVRWAGDGGTIETVVWRNAVTKRTA